MGNDNKRRILGNRITNALIVASDYGWDADRPSTFRWITDQMVRELLGSEEAYRKWVKNFESSTETAWPVGIDPEGE